MCPHYQALNKLTIKDKFPIPIIDDLLDELHGAQFFTKFELSVLIPSDQNERSRYSKIVVHTHERHYELLVMPFGLCNAPTFQSLVNKILKHYLCDFMLVFFEDNLTYSITWIAHVKHVNKALQLL